MHIKGYKVGTVRLHQSGLMSVTRKGEDQGIMGRMYRILKGTTSYDVCPHSINPKDFNGLVGVYRGREYGV